MTENEEYIFDHFLISIKSGFYSIDDIIEDCIEVAEEEGFNKEVTEDWIRENVTKEFNKHLESSKSWNHPTDTEKLHRVFDKLCKEKIVALHNAGYTKQDATYDVMDTWQDIEDEGVTPIGYCYYHGQDLERVIEDGNLMLGFYGATEGNDKEAIIIGNKIVTALKEAGFDVIWNNTASKRIEIPNFNWQNVFIDEDNADEKWGYDRAIKLMTE